MNINQELEKLKKTEKPFLDMVDWHIAFFQERDERKQEIYRAIYETKRKAYKGIMEETYGR